MTGSSYQQRRRRRRQRSTASTVATAAVTAAVAYGTYRFSQWYWKEDECEEGREHPLEDDLSCDETEREHETKHEHERNRNASREAPQTGGAASQPSTRPSTGAVRDSWWSTAVTGVAGWLADAALAAHSPPVGNQSHSNPPSASCSVRARPRQRPTRRQRLTRCRYQTRVAFQNCFPTLRPAIERLTDSSRQTKELKALRRRKQTLHQERNQREDESPDRDHGDDSSESTSPPARDPNEDERELRRLQKREEELWSEILIETTTRMMVSSYACALLLLSLTVQLHWLAAEADRESVSTDEQEQQQQQQQREEQEEFLMRSHRYLLKEGLSLLVATVRRSVETVVFDDDDHDDDHDTHDKGSVSRAANTNHDGWSPEESGSQGWSNPSCQFVTREEIEHVLYRRLPRLLEDVGGGRGGGRRNRHRRRNWIRFILPDDEEFDPIWDICRSPVWEDAQEQVLGCLWHDVLRDGGANRSSSIRLELAGDGGWGGVFETEEAIDGGDFPGDDREEQTQRRPLVKVMARFKKATSAVFDGCGVETAEDNPASRLSDKRSIIGRLQQLPTVLELGDITLQ